MANRKPLVIGSSGKPQQLQTGDTLDAPITGAQQTSQTNGNAGSVVCGAPVYPNGTASTVDKAKADAIGTADVLGLVKDTTIATSASGVVALDGVLTLTTGQWDAVTGDSGGLTPGAIYYLDPATAGKMTRTAPSTVGQVLARLGKALSTVDFLIDIEVPILL